MGLFIDQQQPKQELIDLFRNALAAAPPPDAQAAAVQASDRLGGFAPLATPLAQTLAAPQEPDADAAAEAASSQASQVANQLLGGSKFNTQRFLIACTIFAVLLGAAIWTDADNLKNAPTALFALATTVFGVVVGFLGSESKSGSS